MKQGLCCNDKMSFFSLKMYLKLYFSYIQSSLFYSSTIFKKDLKKKRRRRRILVNLTTIDKPVFFIKQLFVK